MSKQLDNWMFFAKTIQDHPFIYIQELIDFLEKRLHKKNPLMLDLACNVGLTTKMWIDAGYKLISIDCLPEIIEIAKKKIPNHDFRVIDAFDINRYFNNYFDIIYTHQFLQHIKDKNTIIRRMVPILKKSGLVLIWEDTNDNPEFFELSKDGWIEIFTKQGFIFVDYQLFENNTWYLFQKKDV